MSEEANLDAYLKRINYAGSIAPTLETLEMVHRLHPAVIAFENLNPLMGLPVRLQLSDLEQKLLIERRGGYCLEHNLLFKAELEAMDFKVATVGAGVLWGHEEGYVPEVLHHVALLVDVGGVQYLADVGFGGQVASGPLRLRADVEQSTPSGLYRLSGGHPKWRLESEIAGAWTPLYEFTIAPLADGELTVMNDYAMTSFRDQLVAARTDGPKRYALRNARFNTHENGETTTRMLSSVAEIREVLGGTFLINLPDTDRLDAALEKALRPGAND